MTRFECEICNVTLSCEKFWEEHLAGKKHQQHKEKHSQMEAIACRSIYLNNFKHTIDKEELTRIFGEFGEVERVLIDKSGRNGFAIIEFKEKDAAQNLLQTVQRLKIGKSIVRIHPRRMDFGGMEGSQIHVNEYREQINNEKVLHCIQQSAEGFNAQLDLLIAKFSISDEAANERLKFSEHIQQVLQKFFASPIHIRVFGSSSTGLGFINSDLDLNMVFDEDLKNKENDSSIGSPQNSTNSQDIDSATSMEFDTELTAEKLAKSPIDWTTFMKLSKIDRVRLLNRLLNRFRKEESLITAHVPIPDARTPVVRFLPKHFRGLPCELSIQNLLSECKANLIRDLVRAETTGKLWHLLFLLKLWANANGFFTISLAGDGKKKKFQQKKKEMEKEKTSSQKSDEKKQQNDGQLSIEAMRNPHPNSHWNSYILSLCTISFLQIQGKIPPIKQLIRQNSCTIEGWAIEYDLPFFSLDEEIPTLLKSLFTFIYQQLKENHVLVLREGLILETKEFKEKYIDNAEDKRIGKLWRFSDVNIQDPLHLSHNVAANVGHESLAKMRWKVMYAISALKRSPNDLKQLFQLENVQKLQEQRWEEKGINKKRKMTMEEEENENKGKEENDGVEEGMEVDY